MRGGNSIFVKFDVKYFPLADTDAGMATLVGLVTVVTAEVLHRAIICD